MSGYRTDKNVGVHEETDLCDKPPVCGHVAVIDPESADDIERLIDHLDATGSSKVRRADLAAALREFAAPTKPKQCAARLADFTDTDLDVTCTLKPKHISWHQDEDSLISWGGR